MFNTKLQIGVSKSASHLLLDIIEWRLGVLSGAKHSSQSAFEHEFEIQNLDHPNSIVSVWDVVRSTLRLYLGIKISKLCNSNIKSNFQNCNFC